jgi:hypothetical protein
MVAELGERDIKRNWMVKGSPRQLSRRTGLRSSTPRVGVSQSFRLIPHDGGLELNYSTIQSYLELSGFFYNIMIVVVDDDDD